MKKMFQRALAISLAALVVTAAFPIFVSAENGESVSSQRKFNWFLDAGDITDEFISDITALSQSNWSNDYFSVITMILGESKIYVDGQENETSCPPMIDDAGKLMLPVLELAQSVGAQATIDAQTGNIEIEAEGESVCLNALAEVASSNDLLASSLQNIAVTDNNTIFTEITDDSITTQLPVISELQAEEVLNLNIHQDGDKIIITNPYQAKEIVVYVKNGRTLENTYNAQAVVTNGEGLYFLQYETEEQTKMAYEAFETDNAIEHVILNQILASNALPSPGSWGTDGNENSMGIQASRMKTHLQNNDEKIVVAVIDSGADAEYLPDTEGGRNGHSHLQGRTTTATSTTDDKAGWNYINNTNNPYDDSSHGTHVSGTIVDCSPDNVIIMPMKTLNNEGKGLMVNAGLAIRKAYENGAEVFNMSFSGGCWVEDAVEAVIKNATESGQRVPIFVAAAGNQGRNTQEVCPARLGDTYANVITVAAVDQYDLPAYFSNDGDAVTVCAPGCDILSSLPGGGYGKMDGTSMAAPHVSAAVAMLCLEYPDYTSSQIKELLKSMTVDLGTPGWDNVFGSGRIDFRKLSCPGLNAVPSVAATSLSLRNIFMEPKVCSSVGMDHSAIDDGAKLQALVLPKETTDKSVVYTSGSPDIAVYQDGKIMQTGIGSAVIYARKGALTEQRCTVTVWDNWLNHAADSYAGGSGAETDPYLIATAPQLAKLAYDTRINKRNYYNTYFKLTADIDLRDYRWTPIASGDGTGSISNQFSFQGVFDGNGHYITNMTVNTPKYRYTEESGLFGVVYGNNQGNAKKAEIKNLAVTNANVTGPNLSGILCGATANANITNCFAMGTSSCAGFIDFAGPNTTIQNCYSISDFAKAGFIMSSSSADISNCYSAGVVEEAGFIYLHSRNATIKNSFSAVAISNNAYSKCGFAEFKVYGSSSDTTSITKCYYPNIYSGIYRDDNPSTTDLTAKPLSFFKTKSSYTTASNWDASAPWDFDNVWDMDANYNDGLPFLPMFRTYNIEYNAGGYNVPVPPAQVKRHGESLTLSTEVPSREGYEFVHWNTKPDGTGTAYSPGAAFTANANTTLYAIWRINHYTITYYANGGYNAPSSQMATMNTSTTLSLIKPTKVGHTFLGWTPSPVATEPTYYAGQTITLNSSLFLYAVWRENAISAGNSHCLLLDGDGTIWSWGRNSFGQLGDGSTADNYYPVPVDNLSGVVAVAGGGSSHSLALKYNGTVWAWGGNGSGQIGDGTTTNRTTPTQVSNLSNVIAIAAGNSHSLALTSDGRVWAWGSNSYGQLGDRTTTRRTTPVLVQNLTDVVAISAGSSHSLALKSDGTVWAWGYNSSGQLGDGTTTNRSTPTQVLGLTHVTSISTKGSHSMALQDSSVWTWGSNTYGQLGDGTTTKRLTPVKVNIENVVAIAAGGFHSVVIKNDGTAWGWGRNQEGQLGDNTTTNRLQPVQTESLDDLVSISAGTNHTIALQSDGNAWTWGYNAYGQLGDGTTMDIATPEWVWQE